MAPQGQPAAGSQAPALVSERRHVPPAISGGTLLTTRDGNLLVGADPERDQLYFLDARTERLLFTRALQPGDEPGRIAEDAAGNIHVALRGSGMIASQTRTPEGTGITRAAPRGHGAAPRR